LTSVAAAARAAAAVVVPLFVDVALCSGLQLQKRGEPRGAHDIMNGSREGREKNCARVCVCVCVCVCVFACRYSACIDISYPCASTG